MIGARERRGLQQQRTGHRQRRAGQSTGSMRTREACRFPSCFLPASCFTLVCCSTPLCCPSSLFSPRGAARPREEGGGRDNIRRRRFSPRTPVKRPLRIRYCRRVARLLIVRRCACLCVASVCGVRLRSLCAPRSSPRSHRGTQSSMAHRLIRVSCASVAALLLACCLHLVRTSKSSEQNKQSPLACALHAYRSTGTQRRRSTRFDTAMMMIDVRRILLVCFHAVAPSVIHRRVSETDGQRLFSLSKPGVACVELQTSRSSHSSRLCKRSRAEESTAVRSHRTTVTHSTRRPRRFVVPNETNNSSGHAEDEHHDRCDVRGGDHRDDRQRAGGSAHSLPQRAG